MDKRKDLRTQILRNPHLQINVKIFVNDKNAFTEINEPESNNDSDNNSDSDNDNNNKRQ